MLTVEDLRWAEREAASAALAARDHGFEQEGDLWQARAARFRAAAEAMEQEAKRP